MNDLFSLFRYAESKIIVLATIISSIIQTDLFSQSALDYGKMANIVQRTQIVRRKIRLKMHAVTVRRQDVECRFITVQKIRVLFIDRFHNFEQSPL